MSGSFYEAAGTLLSPGDLFDDLTYTRVPQPIKVLRKPKFTLPKNFKIAGEVREVLEVGKHEPQPPFNFSPPGEDIMVKGRSAKAIFLTWGSEVEDDQRRGNLHKKDWLIAPVFRLADLGPVKVPDTDISMVEAIRGGTSPRFFSLAAFPQTGEELYVDFRKLCSLSADHFEGLPRKWRLSPRALNDFYHHLMWFFTRQRVFFGPVSCRQCGNEVDLGVVFEGQSIEPDASDDQS